jgi:hypothetical protein
MARKQAALETWAQRMPDERNGRNFRRYSMNFEQIRKG